VLEVAGGELGGGGLPQPMTPPNTLANKASASKRRIILQSPLKWLLGQNFGF
jgi:hypothetical protein